MAVLHGSWILPQFSESSTDFTAPSTSGQRGYFFIWGETWRRVEPLATGEGPLSHPYALTWVELLEQLRSLQQAQQMNWNVAAVSLEEPAIATSVQGKRTTKSASTPEPAVPPEHHSHQRAIALTVPTYRWVEAATVLPQHSAAPPEHLTTGEHPPHLEFHTWQVGGIALTPLEALEWLNSLPLAVMSEAESFMGGDLRFWSHVARWSLDLSARSKFLPGLWHEGNQAAAFWQVLLDSDVDQARLRTFVRQMPGVCLGLGSGVRGAGEEGTWDAGEEQGEGTRDGGTEQQFPEAREVLLGFLNGVVDAEVRGAIATLGSSGGLNALPATVINALPKDMALREWLQDLGGHEGISSDPNKIERLGSFLANWTAPLQHHLSQRLASFRAVFTLHPPQEGQVDWLLEYGLQAADDPEFLISAPTIWSNPVDRLVYQGRTIDQPQETLLRGLGLASRLYPVLEPSLEVQQPAGCPLNPLQVYEFLRSTSWRLQDSGFGVVLPPSLAAQGGWANRLGLSVRAEAPKQGQSLGLKSLLNFKWGLTIGGQRLTKSEFDRLVALNTPLVEVNGEWVELRPSDIKAAQTFFATRKDDMALSLEDALRISTGDTQMIEKLPVVNFEASGALHDLIHTLTQGNESVEPLPTPKGFRGELRPYQVRGMSWMRFLQRWGLGACLADDMGLGKTPQFIALLLYLKEEKLLDKPTLLVCPTSVLGNWEREVKRFAPSIAVTIHHGDKRPQGKNFAKAVQSKDLVLTSYALVYRDEDALKSVSWQGVVLDEAQNIKNAEAKQSQAVRQLDAEFRIALTGTPVENRLSELWSILDFLNPGYLGPRNFFQRRFAAPIERYGDTDSLRTLRSLVQPFILRRLKTDKTIIQDLPEKQEMTVFCGLTAPQAALYQSLVDQSLQQIESAEGIQRHGMILALLTKLKQVCNHPGLLKTEGEEEEKDEGARVKDESRKSTGKRSTKTKTGESTDSSLMPSLGNGKAEHPSSLIPGSGKLQRLTEMLEELLAEGDRTLIFTQFAEWGKLLKTALEQQFQREVLFLSGSTPREQRETMVDRFQNDPQAPRIFILSLKAGGVGLNLTRANHVFHFDRWWNPAVENQATDRAFRIGQTRNVQVHKFVCTGTLEEKIHEMIESKKALAEQIVGTGENWLTELDTEALRDLLLLDRSAVIDD